jgi:hypothetical protein
MIQIRDMECHTRGPLRLRPGPIAWTAVFPMAPAKRKELVGHGGGLAAMALSAMR